MLKYLYLYIFILFPIFSFSQISELNPTAWYRADHLSQTAEMRIDTLYDKSGNENHFVQICREYATIMERFYISNKSKASDHIQWITKDEHNRISKYNAGICSI
jgi:hypothetical protein